MDILEEVNNVIENKETRDMFFRRVFESTILVDLSEQYDQYIANRQFDQAYNCLQHISRLVVAMLDDRT